MFESGELFVVPRTAWYIEQTGNPMSCIDYSTDGALVAFSNKLGCVDIVSSYDGTIKRELKQTYSNYTVTGLKFHPNDDSLIFFTTKDGFIFMYNILTSESTNVTRHLGSNLLSATIDTFGDTFAIACADSSIRLYDINNFQRTKVLIKMTGRGVAAQTLTIHSMMFHPDNSNVILSAMSNDRIQIWDVRSGNSERCITGPHIRGQGLDTYDGNVVTASYREKKQLEVWDYGTGKKIRDIQFDAHSAGRDCLMQAVKIARNGMDLAAGGAGCNIAQAYNFTTGYSIGQSSTFASPVTSIGTSPYGASFVVGTETGEGSCYMIRLRPI